MATPTEEMVNSVGPVTNNSNKKFLDELLEIKTRLEALQSQFNRPANFLLVIEDNVTRKEKEKKDNKSSGDECSVLCFGQGDIKDFFSKGQLGFQPAMMKFLRAGKTLNADEQFMADWAEGIKQGIKREVGVDSANLLGNMAAMFNQLQAFAAVKQEPRMEGLDGIKSEPTDEDGFIDPSQFLGNVMNPFMAANNEPINTEHITQPAVEGGMNYSCSYCDFKTFCTKRLSVHVRSNHGVTKKLICRECKFTTFTKQQMSSHIMAEHRRDIIRCKEDKCNFYTLNIEHFRKHSEEHKNNIPSVALDFKCDFCNFRSSSRKGIGVHINRSHTEESPQVKMIQKKKNQRHEAKKQELQALIDQQRRAREMNNA